MQHRRRALVFAALLGSAPAAGHHSFSAIFDANKPVTLTGTVTRIEWMNPHTWIYLDVKKDDGSVEAWAFEMGSPNRLMRFGWNQGSLPTGASVTIVGSQARDGSMKAAVDTVTLPDGKRLLGAQDSSN
jgi:DNA/RNA endonuclease YhcR with UshA esterase domain